MKSLSKKKTNKAEWDKTKQEIGDIIGNLADTMIEAGARCVNEPLYNPIAGTLGEFQEAGDKLWKLFTHQRQEILEEIKADIMDIVHTSDGTTDWFHGLRCAAGVCESKLSALLQVKNKNEKTDQ